MRETTIDCRAMIAPDAGMNWICKVLGLDRKLIEGYRLTLDVFDDPDTPVLLDLHIYGCKELDEESGHKMIKKLWSALSSVVSDD